LSPGRADAGDGQQHNRFATTYSSTLKYPEELQQQQRQQQQQRPQGQQWRDQFGSDDMAGMNSNRLNKLRETAGASRRRGGFEPPEHLPIA
jgi:hypothetical protein